ncbi:MAG: hypothetical protein SNJ78_10005 [Spirochaetales bacterium]
MKIVWTRPLVAPHWYGIVSRRVLRWGMVGLFLFSLSFFIPALDMETGASFGVGVQWIGGSDFEKYVEAAGMETRNTSDFLYGLYFRVPLMNWKTLVFALRPEVQLMRPGGAGSGLNKELDVSSRVLHFPLSFEVHYPVNLGALYAFVGPSLNLFLTEIDSRLRTGNSESTFSQSPYYGVVTGIVAGGGYSVPLTSLSIIFEIRYTHTLTLVLKDKDTTFGGFYFLLGAGTPLKF